MIIVGVLATLSLNQSFSRMAISLDARRRWEAVVVISLITWFGARMILGQSRIVAPARLVPLSFLVSYSALTLAMVIGPYVRQVALTGHSIAYLDYVLMIPGFAVPILMLMHINSLFNLRTRKRAERNLTTSSS